MKNLTIGKRIAAGFGIVLILLVAVGALANWGIGSLEKGLTEVVDYNTLAAALTAREIDHLNWAGNVSKLFLDNSVVELNVETDDHKCAFGKWYYSDERKEAEARVPAIGPMLNAIEEHHHALHLSAVDIASSFKDGDAGLAEFLAEKESDHLRWANGITTDILQRSPAISAEVDPRACGLGQFLYGEGKKLASEDPTLASMLSALEERHAALHTSAKQLVSQWNADDESVVEATRLAFETATLPQLAQTQETLLAMREQINADVDGYDAARQVYQEKTLPALAEVQKYLKAAVHEVEGAVTANTEAAVASGQRSRFTVVATSVGAVLLGIFFSLIIARSIIRVLAGVSGSLEAGSEQVASASGQVSEASQQLAEGASEQAAAIEEISASLEQLAAMTRQNNESAAKVDSMTREARVSTDSGQEAMNRMSGAISDIKRSSDETARIIKTIDEIAFQTNLLALNAAVEAARAGEAGKGFAVVAEEVRNLAQRSADAARQTADLILTSQTNAEKGVVVTTEVDRCLKDIGHTIEKVGHLVQEVAAASKEQAQGVDQINTAVNQLDSVTQGTAASAEESASASEELSAQAVELTDMVMQLNALTGAGNREPAAVPPSAARSRGGSRKPAKTAGAPHWWPLDEQESAGKRPQHSGNGHAGKSEKAAVLDKDDISTF
jgi:methyl-accepting chemotaxis protein